MFRMTKTIVDPERPNQGRFFAPPIGQGGRAQRLRRLFKTEVGERRKKSAVRPGTRVVELAVAASDPLPWSWPVTAGGAVVRTGRIPVGCDFNLADASRSLRMPTRTWPVCGRSPEPPRSPPARRS